MLEIGAAASQVESTLLLKGATKLPGLIAKATKRPLDYAVPWLQGPGRSELPIRFPDRVEYNPGLEFYAKHLQTAAAVLSAAATIYSNELSYRSFVEFFRGQMEEIANHLVLTERLWKLLNLVRGMYVALRYDDDIEGMSALGEQHTNRMQEVLGMADSLLTRIGQLEGSLLKGKNLDVSPLDIVAMFEESKASRAMAVGRRQSKADPLDLPSFPGLIPLTTLLYRVSGDARLQIKSGRLHEAGADVRQSIKMAREAGNTKSGDRTAQFKYWDDSPYMQSGIGVSNAVSTIHMMGGMYELLLAWDDAKLSARMEFQFRSALATASTWAGKKPNIWHNSFAHSVLVWGLFCHHRQRHDAAERHFIHAREMFRASGDGYRARELDER